MRGLKDQRLLDEEWLRLAVLVLVSFFGPTGSEQDYLVLGTSPRRSFLGASLVVGLDVVRPSFFLFPFGLIAVTWAAGLPFPVVFACFCLSMLTVRAGELAFLDRGAPALGFLYGLRTVITKVDSIDSAVPGAENGAMKLTWGMPTGTGMASAVLLLCLSAVIALAACGGEQAAPVADTPVPVEPKAVSAPSTTFSAAAEPQPTATTAPVDTPAPVPTPTQTPKEVATPAPAPLPTATRTSTPAPTPAAVAELTRAQTSAETDREALVALYNAAGPNWNSNNNWLTDMPISEWSGVTTDDKGRVTELVLSSNQLSGEIPPELGNLADLTGLTLNGNLLSGCVPSSLLARLNMDYSNLGDLRFCP